MTNWSNFDYENEENETITEQEKFYNNLNSIFSTIQNIIIISTVLTIIIFIIMLICVIL